MQRRLFLLGAVSALCLSGPAQAQQLIDRLVADLQSQGFDRISIKRTLLGRMRIVAVGKGGRREIVINPATGEVLRDYLDYDYKDEDDDRDEDESGRGRGRGRGGDDDDDHDDEDEPDQEDEPDEEDDSDDEESDDD